MANETVAQDHKIEGTGTFQLPPGMTQQEAERLVHEADNQRKQGK